MQKNSLFLPAILLCIICLVTTGLVSLTYVTTQVARDEQAAIAANANRRLLCPEAVSFEPLELGVAEIEAGLTEAYTAEDAEGQPLAWLFVAQAKGYGGQLPIMLAVDTDGLISGLKVLDNNETPGLGKKVANESFFRQFVGQGTVSDFSVKPSGDQIGIDAVAGATISSRAVANAVNTAVNYFQQMQTEVN